MIQEEGDPVIDFSWFYFIGKTKLNQTYHETGRMTLTLFNKMYMHYKNDWDYEMRLRNANVTYSEAFQEAQRDEMWF